MPAAQPGTHEDFEVAAQAIWDGLPEQFCAVLGNMTVHVADFADTQTLKALHICDPYNLLGLYHGVGLPSKSVWDPASLPDRIFLYRMPILSYADRNGEPGQKVGVQLHRFDRGAAREQCLFQAALVLEDVCPHSWAQMAPTEISGRSGSLRVSRKSLRPKSTVPSGLAMRAQGIV